ncbi:unnamed protein product [Lactuca saligna]|uniref:FAR1 domain-containing protein n=1 Tax=Lactuca saligna TaxID=75948 RepID=A0AA35YT47_LACSI|nr:unnamed protein product [Lactuca saligna]
MQSLPEESSSSKLDPMSVQSVSRTDELNVQSLAQSDYDISTESESEAGQDRFCEFFSPGGARKIWILEDVDDVKPKLFSKYLSIEDAMDMYRVFAAKAGFDVRKGSTKINTKSRVLTHRFMLCNREGFPQSVYVDTTDSKNNKPHRNSNIKRKGCPAFAKFRRVGNSDVFELYKFEERHNHDLVAKDYRHFLRSNRQLDNTAQEFIEKKGRVKIGPMKAYKLMQELKGANTVGGTVVDYKIQSRKVNCFIEKDDAQMVCAELADDMKFKKRFNKLIWNSGIDASEFDIRWRSFIEDYKLQEISWFSKVFHMRESWIPAYFRDMPLSGLMRTTSRLESMNSAFNKTSH